MNADDGLDLSVVEVEHAGTPYGIMVREGVAMTVRSPRGVLLWQRGEEPGTLAAGILDAAGLSVSPGVPVRGM